MAQSIRNLALGSIIKDNNGNRFYVVEKNSNSVTLWAVDSAGTSVINVNTKDVDYGESDINYYLNNQYSKRIDSKLLSNILVSNVDYIDYITNTQKENKILKAKFFLINKKYSVGMIKNEDYWTREEAPSVTTPYREVGDTYEKYYTGYHSRFFYNNIYGSKYEGMADKELGIYPAFNVSNTLLVSNNVEDGSYSFVFNTPPVISTINNLNGNYGSSTNITYTVIDSDDNDLTHYISFDNGNNWKNINPSRINNTYTYTHVFNELGNYNCRIKVVDSANNVTTSNMFVVSVNSTAPTINIVSVIDRVVTFKASCITDEVSKVEVLINGSVKQTFTSGLDFNLTYEINRSDLKVGKNAIQLKATSKVDLIGTRDLEANKTTYNLPPVGTKVEIGGHEYSITSATQSGANQIYTLDKNLLFDVSANDVIKVLQDRVKVLCSLSNIESQKQYKEMKLIKSKKLKGVFDGYVEEKYELKGEGRYSTVKLDLERFNSNVDSEIIELQQYFDYVED